MAYDYEKVKQAYEGLDAQQKQQFADMMKWSGNYADFMSRYNAEKTPTATASTTTANSSTPTQTSTSRDIAKPEYQWTWSIWTKTSPYENQGEWNYYYSNQTNRYEKYPTATQTSTQTTKVETPAENDTVKQLRDAWNNKSYEEQQKLLKSNPAMQNTLTKYWITNKQPEATPAQTPTQTPTTQKDKEWDYQDNSQARMDEIIRNLDWFRVTDPYLFDNYDTFYNAFIAGKGRSQDQIKTLNDYFKKMKQYNKYDNLSSDEVGWMIARWEIPDDYLNYLKNSDPQRWAEIQWVRKDVEDQIMNESYLNTIASDAWFDMWESDFMKWQKWTFWLQDNNSDWLWDIIYHAPTQEELDLNNEDNEYEAEKLRIKNAYKDLQSDLADQYPDADLSTIMVLAWDRGNKMMKALDSISVAQTKTQWRLKYLQNERAEMDKAWQTQINELQQNLWMYYQYSPEWMSALAQAQYAATNVTLDQADNWTDTQKQMALESILTPIYEQYWSIIERPMAQVINDVMSYAKKNWTTLSQALKENFTDKLKSKEAYQAIQGQLTEPNLQIIWYNSDGKAVYWYWDSATKTFKSVTASWVDGWTSEWTSYTTNVQPLNNFITNLENKYTIASNWWTWGSKIRGWWCWTVVNDYLWSVWDNIKLTEANDIKPYATSKVPAEWAIAYFDWTQPRATPETKKHGHVWIVVSDNGDTITVLESNEWTWLRYKDYNKSWVTGYYVPNWIKTNEYNQKEYSDAFTKAGNIIATWINWVENKKMFKEALQWLLDEWDYSWAFEYITVTWKNNADSDARDKIIAAETAMTDLISIRDALDAYYAAWWDTGILQWSLEKVANKLWKTTDPKLVWLATKISEAIQAYRKNISWTAFSEKEAAEYEALFPTIAAWQEYNNAKLTSTLDSMVIRLNQLYGWLIWPRTYINVLDAHEKATWNRYSMYEQQSQLYNYLSENGYLNADWTVKSEDDLASWYAQYNQRKWKRF